MADERGAALIESVIALLVVVVVGIAGYSGFVTAIRQSSGQVAIAREETLLRTAAEQIQSPDYAYQPRANCPGRTAYVVPSPATAAGVTVTVQSVMFWGGASNTPSTAVAPTFSTACPATDAADLGLQRIVLRATRTDGSSDTLTIVKRRP